MLDMLHMIEVQLFIRKKTLCYCKWSCISDVSNVVRGVQQGYKFGSKLLYYI